MKQLSIIIPIYNVEEYVERCIDSVYQQGLQESDFEIIVVDDASPDNSLQIVQGIQKKHSNITIISQSNKGLGGARNTGVAATKTEYLLFLDSDDFLEPSVVPSYLELANTHKTDFVEFGVQAAYMDGSVKVIKQNTSNGKVYDGITYANTFKYMYSSDNKVYRTAFLHENKLEFMEHIYIEDYEFMTRVYRKAKRIVASDLIGVNYLQSPNSITRSTDPKKKQKKLDDIKQILGIIANAKKEALANGAGKEIEKFYDIRLSFLNVTIMTQLIKDKAPFEEMSKLRAELINAGVWTLDEPVVEWNRNLLRIALKNNFGLFKMIQPMLKLT